MCFYKKEKTSSYFTYIIKLGKHKFIRQYKRNNNEIHGYPRTVPTEKTMNLLNDNANIYSPRLLRNRTKYIDQEFIDGKAVDLSYDKDKIINIVSNYIINMYKIDTSSISNYILWSNNTLFLKFLIDNLDKVKSTFTNNTNNMLNLLNINNTINELRKIKLDDSRNLSLIHGDIHNGNMIEKDDHIYLLDWELATRGDIAYEVAIHSILMNYTDKQQMKLIDNISNSLKFDKIKFIDDVNTYKLFEMLRRAYIRLNKVVKLISNNKSCDVELKNFYAHYEKLTKLLKLEKLNLNELKKILRLVLV